MELDEAIHSCQVALGFNRLQQLWGLRTNLTKVDYHHFFGSTLYCNPLWNKFQSFVVYTLQPFHSLTDWQTWRPSILNVCTYLSSDGQLVSQGSVLRSWSIHPWPTPNPKQYYNLSRKLFPRQCPKFSPQWQCPSCPTNDLCLWFHLPNIWADKLGNVKTGRFFRKIYLGQVMNIRTKEAKVKSSPR